MLEGKLKKWTSKPELVFLALGTFFGLLSAVMLPLFGNPDEGYHFYGSYAIFSSDADLPDDILVSPFRVLETTDASGYSTFFTEQVDLEDDTIGIALRKGLPPSPDGHVHVPPVASITDVSHLPQAIGILVGKLLYPSLGVMVFMGRFLNLAVYLVAIYLLIKHVKFAKWAFVAIALLPMLIHQAGSLSYDVMNIVAIFSYVALMINLYTQKKSITRNQVITLVSISVLLLLTKPSNIVLLLFIPFLPKTLYVNTRLGEHLRSNRHRRLLLSLCAVVLASFTVLFVFIAQKYLAGHSIDPLSMLKVILRTYSSSNPEFDPIITSGIIGNFSWNYYRFPDWVVIVNAIALVLVLLRSRILNISKRFALLSLVILISYVLVVTVGLYFSWTLQPFVLGENAAYAKGLQGRYFTPLLVLLIPCAAYLQKYIRVQVKEPLLALLIITVSILSLTYYLILTYMFFYV